jgi:hypothetical protein
MVKTDISVINRSTLIQDSEIMVAMEALQAQVTNDFAPVWGVDAQLTLVPEGGNPKPNTWWLVILDTSDQAGALGYHDLTQEGLPLGKVFAQSDLDAGTSWTVTASHELLEMLVDPDINLTVFVQPSATAGTLYAYEVCDACEADGYGYTIGKTLVSDFVYPAWFESFRTPHSTKFDRQGKITQPFQLLSGGYIGVFDVSFSTGWHQLTPQGEEHAYNARPRIGSRRERRRTPKGEWIVSAPRPMAMARVGTGRHESTPGESKW